MKKTKILITIAGVLMAILTCKTTSESIGNSTGQIVDNTFQATVVNKSPFIIEIDGKRLKQGESVQNAFPLEESEVYDGWNVDFTIPLSKDVFYLHKEKVDITNKQATVVIEAPRKNDIREAYIVIRNVSKQPIQLTNGKGSIFPCCFKERINTQYAKKEHNIAPSKTAVYEIYKQEEMKRIKVFASQGKKDYPLLENTSVNPGYVYTYEFNGKDAVKVDERPILKMGESSWKQEDVALSIEKILENDGLYYLAGNKRVLDSYGNAYSCPYMRCIDGANNLKWQTEDISIDGYIQDAVLLEDGSILSCGQSLIKENNVGSLWLYSRDGILHSSKNYSDFQLITHLALMDDGVVISGFDNEGKLKLSKISIANNTISATKKLIEPLPNEIIESTSFVSLLYETTSKTLFLFCNLVNEDEATLPSKLFAIKANGKIEEVSLGGKIASVSSVVQSANGIYAGGESTLDEKSESVVLKIEADKDASVRTSSLFYQGKIPFSYITSMTLDEESRTLTVGGVCKAKKSSGLVGIPFIASFDIISGKELIYREYKSSKKQIVRSFVPALDYGFIACFSSVIQDDGEFESYGQSMWSRMSATGVMKD